MKYILCIVCFGFLSCEQEKRKIISIDNNNFKEIVYSGNSILSEKQFTIDKQDTFLNGVSYEYYKSGKLKAESFYKMDLKDSVENKYFESGSKSAIYVRHFGRLVGKQVEYYRNGKIDNIVLSNGIDTNIFQLHYLRNGKTSSVSGVPMYVDLNRKTLSIKDEFILAHVVIREKNVYPILNIKIISPSGKTVLDSTIKKFVAKNNNDFFIFKGVFTDTGKYVYVGSIQLRDRDKNNNIITEGLVTDTINVIK